MIELAVFLGNPGKKYSRHRHNAGFMLADKLSFNDSLPWQNKFRGIYAAMDRSRLSSFLPDGISPREGSPQEGADQGKVHFIKPETFMNLSGGPVAEAASFFKIKNEAILVVHDELELPLGTVSLKFGGGLGGHNGLRSMKASLGNADFWRIRIGIGRPDSRSPGEGGPPGSGEGIVDWVLSGFSAQEAETLDIVLNAAGELLLKVLAGDPKDHLKEWAKKNIVPL